MLTLLKPLRASQEALGVKNPPAKAGDLRDVGSMKIPWRRAWLPLQCSCLENLMDREAWQAIVHGLPRVGHNLVTKPAPPVQEIWVQSLGQEDPLEKEITHSVFLLGRSHGQGRLVGYSPWGCKRI